MSLAGVIGYAPRNTGRPERTPAATMPSGRAVLPVTLRYRPRGSEAGATSYRTAKSSVVSPKFQPALNAAMLAAASSGREANFFSRNARVDSDGREKSQGRNPTATRF